MKLLLKEELLTMATVTEVCALEGLDSNPHVFLRPVSLLSLVVRRAEAASGDSLSIFNRMSMKGKILFQKWKTDVFENFTAAKRGQAAYLCCLVSV